MIVNFRSTMFVKLFATYFILFMIIGLLFSFAFFRQIDERHQAIRQKENQNKVEQLTWLFDDKFSNMDRIGTLLSNMQWVLRVRSQSEIILRNIDLLRRQEINREMNIYHTTIRTARSTALMLPHRNIVIDNASFWDEHNYFISIGRRGMTISGLIDALPDYSIALTIAKPDVYSSNNNDFFVIKQLNYTIEPELVLFVYVNGMAFANMIRQNSPSNDVNFSIKQNGKLLFSSTTQVPAGSQIYSYAAPSALFLWEYHFQFALPPTGMHTMTGLLVFTGFFIIFIAASIALLLSRMSYAPIKELLFKLGLGSDSHESELASIEKFFLTLREEKQDFELLSRRHFTTASNNLLIILLNGLFDESVTHEMLLDYGLHLSDDMSYVVAILTYPEAPNAEERLRHYVQLQSEFASSKKNIHCVELANHNIVLIIDCTGDNDTYYSEHENYLRRIINHIASDAMETYLGFRHKGFIGISKSYQDAKDHLNGNFALDTLYYYPDDWKAQLNESAKADYRPMADKLLQELHNENKKRNTSFEDTCIVATMILDTFVRTLDIPATKAEAIMAGFDHKARHKNSDLIWDYLTQCLEENCPYPITDASTEIGNQIIAHIDEHIFDQTLSQQGIAMEFGLSRPMVSKLFKKAANMNFFDYVHNKRIQEAKNYFDNGERNILSVAQSVGYTNELTFKRAFMRTEAITPKQYIKNLI